MIKHLISWAVGSRLVVMLLAIALLAFGLHAFHRVNVEAYPDPAPAIVEVIARFPGASPEEVERQVTIPLEVALSGMPGLTHMRSQSLFELGYVRNQFEYGVSLNAARQDVLNRLRLADLPQGVVPDISPESPTGEIVRYTLIREPGAPYTLSDLKSLQDYTLERAFRRVPRIADVVSFGGTVKRYEVHPDPARMQRYGITLKQLQQAIGDSNTNVGGQYVAQGEAVQVVRGVGLFGQGNDPMERAVGMKDSATAARYLRQEEQRRIRAIRQVVLAAVNNVPVRVEDVIEGGPLERDRSPGERGVVVAHQTRLGRVMHSYPKKDAHDRERLGPQGPREWVDEEDVVQGIVLLRKGEESLPALKDVLALINDLNNTPGRLLPGVKIRAYYDRTALIHATTDTVQENLLLGMGLVTAVLLMFLSNVRAALIVAVNVPMALLFAFAVLFLRGSSANLLSIGAVDFGIIVDSSVIIVENVFRHLSSGSHAALTHNQRVIRAASEIQRSLLFSTAIMVCAFLPLFTMSGPEGQIFGPMADTYAFALGGALVLALTLSPVLCSLLLRNLRPRPENFFVRYLQRSYIRQLTICLDHRWLTMLVFGGLVALTISVLPLLGQEFMPELEEGNLWIRGTFPLNASLDETARRVRVARDIMKGYPELAEIVMQLGRPDDGTDATGFYNSEYFVPLKPESQWPIPPGRALRRTKPQLIAEMNAELVTNLIGVSWNFSQNIRDNVMESISGVKGENSVKIIGPDLAQLEQSADRVVQTLNHVRGVEGAGVFHILGQTSLVLPPDPEKCSRWGVRTADVNEVIETAIGGKPFSRMTEGERSFDITLRWPDRLRSDQAAILEIPVDIAGNTVAASSIPNLPATPMGGPSSGPSPTGTKITMPSPTGSNQNATVNSIVNTPRRRIRDLVTPLGPDGQFDSHGSFVQPGASIIYREQGNRVIAIKFDVRERDLASTVAEAQQKTKDLVQPPYRMEWSGEFQEMEQAQGRLLLVVPLALSLVVILLYLAFRNLTDILLVLSDVVSLLCGGIWALLLTRTNFSISAAVGFISIFGVAVMNSLLLVSTIHRLRLEGHDLHDALIQGAQYRLRPTLMVTLAAIFGLLPAALSTRIGAQSQRPLAIVVIGGMVMVLLLNRYLTPVLYSIVRRTPPSSDAASLAE